VLNTRGGANLCKWREVSIYISITPWRHILRLSCRSWWKISFTIRLLPYLPEKNLQSIEHVTSILPHENNIFKKKHPEMRAREGQVTVIRPSIGVKSREHWIRLFRHATGKSKLARDVSQVGWRHWNARRVREFLNRRFSEVTMWGNPKEDLQRTGYANILNENADCLMSCATTCMSHSNFEPTAGVFGTIAMPLSDITKTCFPNFTQPVIPASRTNQSVRWKQHYRYIALSPPHWRTVQTRF
jgi:hypothetical protein